MTRSKKDFWETVLKNPSFNNRFIFTVICIFVLFISIGYTLLHTYQIVKTVGDQVAILNLLIQSATLVFGIIASFYALRQVVETRLIGLNESAYQDLKRKHYNQAYKKWKESFYIKPDVKSFQNLTESLLLASDWDTFDYFINSLEDPSLNRKDIFEEKNDKIILLYLKSLKALLTENLGEAKIYINLIVDIGKIELPNLDWDFLDLQTSLNYQNLKGECRVVLDNLIAYLQKTMTPTLKDKFNNKNFSATD